MKSFPILTLSLMLLCMLTMSVASYNGDDDNTELVKYRYLYLKATCKNINGDYHVYSKVLEIKSHSTQVMEQRVQHLLFAFEDELYSQFPQAHFVASHNWVAGTFTDGQMAESRRMHAMGNDDNAIEVLINGGIVNY